MRDISWPSLSPLSSLSLSRRTMTANPNPNSQSMAMASPPFLTLTLTLILIAFSPLLSGSPLPHSTPSPSRRPPPPHPHPPPRPISHPPPHPPPTSPSQPKPPSIVTANPATVHRISPPSDQRPPCGPVDHGGSVGHDCRNETHLPLHSPPPPHLRKERLNFGKKLGLLFVGVGVLLQIGLGGFLAFKRWQLKKLEDGTWERRSARRRLRISSSGSSS